MTPAHGEREMTDTPNPSVVAEAARKIELWIKCGMPDQSGNTPTREALKRDLRTLLADRQASARREEELRAALKRIAYEDGGIGTHRAVACQALRPHEDGA